MPLCVEHSVGLDKCIITEQSSLIALKISMTVYFNLKNIFIVKDSIL